MISVCVCGINSKYDVEAFVECLKTHNPETKFEVCFAHDNRVEDGARDYYKKLMDKYPWFRVIENTKEETVAWIDWTINLYEQRGIFTRGFRDHLRSNLDKYSKDELCDVSKTFMWISSGYLYNKAVSISTGDFLLVSPVDFIYLFGLKDLEEEMIKRTSWDGYSFAKPGAIWARISNCPEEWLISNMKEENKRTDHPFNSRCAFAQRDYLRYPSKAEDMFLVDFRKEQLVSLADPEFIQKMGVYTTECFQRQNDQQVSPGFHGVHVMSRKAYEEIGGFSELYCGRSFADDHMSKRGVMLAGRHGVRTELPYKFSFAWLGPGEFLPGRFTYMTPEEYNNKLKSFDPLYYKHPIPGASGWCYIHNGYPDSGYLNSLNSQLSKYLLEHAPRFTRI